MNLDFFGVFDYSAGDSDIYEYTASEFNEIFRAITTNGVVHNYLNDMAVSANGLTITVATGGAFINGRYGKISTPKQLTLDVATSARYDMIVLRLDVPNRLFTLDVKQNSNTLTQDENVYELALAQIYVPADSTATQVVDKRTFFYTPTEAAEKLDKVLTGKEAIYARYA